MLSFCISSFFAGIGSALLAMYQTSVQAAIFKSAMTYEILLIVVIGGIGSISGSIIASFLYIACSEWWLRFLDQETILTTAGRTEFIVVMAIIFAVLLAGMIYKIVKPGDKKRTRFIVGGGKLGSGLHPGDSYGGTPAAGRGIESGCSLLRRKQHP